MYVVATPIGNLGDLSARAADTLSRVELIAAEDTRHTRRLLEHVGISTPMVALHEHNEREQVGELLTRMHRGERLALVCDAGTPLINDPGFRLLRAVHAAGLRVATIPGPCAAIAALSAAGLPTDRFSFEGFMPARQAARQRLLEQLRSETRTLIFYVSPRQLRDSLDDCALILDADRPAVVARELTKVFESYYHGTVAELAQRAAVDADMQRGEIVLLIAAMKKAVVDEPDSMRTLTVLLEAGLPLKQAVDIAVQLVGDTRNRLYQMALQIKENNSPQS